MLSKWNTSVKPECSICKTIETTEHMLYECQKVKGIWRIVSLCLGMDVRWKQTVIVFPLCHDSNKVIMYNNLLTTVAYSIFKTNMYCKYNIMSYSNIDIYFKLRKICILS